MENKRILIVHKDNQIGEYFMSHLKLLGAEVVVTQEGKEGLYLARTCQWDLLILATELSDFSGLTICHQLRRHQQMVPVMLLGSSSPCEEFAECERVVGLESGADEYIPDSASILELVARTRALFRRRSVMLASESPLGGAIRIKNLEVIESDHVVRLLGKEIDLTAREFKLLLHFVKHPGRVFSRAELLDMVWGYNHAGYQHTVDSHINRLRSKLKENSRQPEYIKTCWGVGYKLNPV